MDEQLITFIYIVPHVLSQSSHATYNFSSFYG